MYYSKTCQGKPIQIKVMEKIRMVLLSAGTAPWL